jgi:hypothetical protein
MTGLAYNYRMRDVKSAVEKFIKFRRNMGLGLDFGKARYIWGKKEIKVLEGKEVDFIKRREENLFVNEKVSLVEENVKKLLLFKWVKFIGVSGSVAAGFAKDEDDIDLFIVVKDGTAWLYRGVLTLRGLFNGLFRGKRHGEDVKNLFCFNLICEESGLNFDNDIFDFHELMYLIPVYEKKYLKYIYSQNSWLKNSFGVKKELLMSKYRRNGSVNVVIRFFNILAFWSQVLFMSLTGHSPEIERLRKNFRKGRIEFFPEDYKGKYLRS